jgi:hypothetical protein
MRRLVCVKQTFPVTVSYCPLRHRAWGILAVSVFGMGWGLAQRSGSSLTSSFHPHSDEPVRALCLLGFDCREPVLPSAMRPLTVSFPLAVTGIRSTQGQAV